MGNRRHSLYVESIDNGMYILPPPGAQVKILQWSLAITSGAGEVTLYNTDAGTLSNDTNYSPRLLDEQTPASLIVSASGNQTFFLTSATPFEQYYMSANKSHLQRFYTPRTAPMIRSFNYFVIVTGGNLATKHFSLIWEE